MQITWLGHSSFRIVIENAVLLIDPWIADNPMFPKDNRAAALEGVTHILTTHAHSDHAADASGLSKEFGVPIVGMYELVNYLAETTGSTAIGFNKGGTVTLAGARVSLVSASHSSSLRGPNGPIYAGSETGFMIAGEGHMIYVSGDTDVMADMDWMGDFYNPDIGILSCGGHFTMDMARAAYAAKRYFRFKTLIPCHYRTFSLLEQTAQSLAAALPGVTVIEPHVMQPIEI